jgi:surface carbohydrate biosynthesis protein
MKKRIGIFLDSYWRDAPGVALLKIELEKLDVDVDIVPFDLWNEYLQLINPNHVVLNHMFGIRNKKIAKHVKQNRGIISVLPTEGRPNTNIQNDWYTSQVGFDYFFHWSNLTKKDKRIGGGVYGCPRFEVLRNSDLLLSKDEVIAKHSLDPYRPILLFATSFPQAKFHTQASYFNKVDWEDLDVPFDAVHLSKLEYFAREKSLLLLQMIASHSNYQIILRPHPMEDTVWWERNIPEGCVLITQEFIGNLISASDIIVNRVGCTTTLESWVMGKHVVSMEYTDESSHGGAVADLWKVSLSVNNLPDAIQLIFHPEEFKIPKLYLKKMGLMRNNVAGRIAQKMEEITPENNTNIPFTSLLEWNKIQLDHNDKNVYPVPGFHPGKIPSKYKIDNLVNLYKEKLNDA